MSRRLVGLIVLIAMTTSACGLTRVGGPPEAGPEQFNFVIVPGDQLADEAAAAVGDIANGSVEDAVHVGSVTTPLGKTDIYTYTEVKPDGNWTCQAMVQPGSASAGCGQGGEIDAAGADEVRVSGTGSDGTWATVEMRVGEGVRSVVVTADDGTKYKTNAVAGLAMVVYPISRGGVTAQAFGGGDQPIGKPVIIESLP